MKNINLRRVMVLSLYIAALAHLVVGMALPWIIDLPLLTPYHRMVLSHFNAHGIQLPQQAQVMQMWWISLFGPTMQSVGLWMAALTYFGDRYRSRVAWGSLIAGILIWAPQDMWISLRMDVWLHVWIDALAVAMMLPQLLYLVWKDRLHYSDTASAL